MTSLQEIVDQPRVVLCLAGFPGSGKTGSLAPLVNAGFKLRILDFDGNLAPLAAFTDPEHLGLVDFITFEDRLKDGPQGMEPDGPPTAYTDACNAMRHWRYAKATGRVVDALTAQKLKPEEIVDLGRPEDWGPDTIVVLDSGTALGRAAKRRVAFHNNRTRDNFRDSDYGAAMQDQEAFIENLTSSKYHFHAIVMFHLKIIGPRDVRKGDSDLTKNIKQQMGGLIEARYFPTALGWALPQTIAEHFPTLVLAESEVVAGKTRRVLRTKPRPEVDAKVPALKLPPELPIEDGMLTLFNALTGGVEKCLTLKN